MKELKDALKDNLGIALSTLQEEQFATYISFLVEYNQHTNLTRIPESEIPLLHFYDSLSICEFIDFTKIKNLIDIGTGAGFPGVPLKIIFPDLKVTLVDSRNKKVSFLKELCSKLELQNIEAVHGRAEDLSKLKSYQEKYEAVTARAVSEVQLLLPLLAPFRSKTGKIIMYKGPKAEEEIKLAKKVISKSGLRKEEVHKVVLPYGKQQRTILIFS